MNASGRIRWPWIAVVAMAVAPAPAVGQPTPGPTEGDYLYRISLLRAAPGAYTELRSAIGDLRAATEHAGDHPPFWIRHSQGDHWDFMLLQPMDEYETYHAEPRVRRRAEYRATTEGRDLHRRLAALAAYREDWFARSVSPDELDRRFDGMELYHVEMFVGLPGSRAELVEQRRMENRYYEHLDRQQNLIFVRDAGSNWDVMTLGFHPDLASFAAAGDRFTSDQQDEAARAAGFESVREVGPYLRSLLDYHNDTLAVPGE